MIFYDLLLFFFLLFGFCCCFPLPLSLGWNSHAYAQGSSIPGLQFFVSVSRLAWVAMDELLEGILIRTNAGI